MNVERKCVTHHNACDCREEKIKRLVLAMREVVDSWDDEGVLGLKSVREWVKEWEGEFEK